MNLAEVAVTELTIFVEFTHKVTEDFANGHIKTR